MTSGKAYPKIQVLTVTEMLSCKRRESSTSTMYSAGCVALTGPMADGWQGWPELQAIPAATIDHVWNAFL